MSGMDAAQAQREHERGLRPRIAWYDTLRGFTIVSMCAFHTCYDLAYLYGLNMPGFTDALIQSLWRDSISFTFLILAGWMTSYTRNNFRRAGIYALAALAVWAATTVAAVDTPVNFGILYCMAACTFIWACLEHIARGAFKRLSNAAFILIGLALVAAFVFTGGIPTVRYPFEGLAWLGFPSVTFASGDYYPLIPFVFLYLLGAFGAIRYRRAHAADSAWMLRDWCPPLTTIGRHSLLIYLLHQPVVLLVLQFIFR